MIRTTLWKPDTCSCEIEYSWDDTVPQDQRVHTPVRSVRKCAAHAAATTPVVHHADLMDENPRKNKAEARLLAAFPAVLGFSYTDPETGQTSTKLKPDAYTYAITGGRGSRVIHLTINYLSAAQKTAVQTWCNNNLGAGKVVVD